MKQVLSTSKRHSSAVKSDERGATLVEFAFAALIFFTTVFFSMDFFIVNFKKVATQHAVHYSLRKNSVANTTGSARATSIKTEIIDRLESWGITVNANDIRVCSESNTGACNAGTSNAGGSNQLVLVRVSYNIPSIISPRTYTIDVGAMARNEPL